jgi:hypothetical protein
MQTKRTVQFLAVIAVLSVIPFGPQRTADARGVASIGTTSFSTSSNTVGSGSRSEPERSGWQSRQDHSLDPEIKAFDSDSGTSLDWAMPDDFSCTNVAEIPQAECEALAALYNLT